MDYLAVFGVTSAGQLLDHLVKWLARKQLSKTPPETDRPLLGLGVAYLTVCVQQQGSRQWLPALAVPFLDGPLQRLQVITDKVGVSPTLVAYLCYRHPRLFSL